MHLHRGPYHYLRHRNGYHLQNQLNVTTNSVNMSLADWKTLRKIPFVRWHDACSKFYNGKQVRLVGIVKRDGDEEEGISHGSQLENLAYLPLVYPFLSCCSVKIWGFAFEMNRYSIVRAEPVYASRTCV